MPFTDCPYAASAQRPPREQHGAAASTAACSPTQRAIPCTSGHCVHLRITCYITAPPGCRPRVCPISLSLTHDLTLCSPSPGSEASEIMKAVCLNRGSVATLSAAQSRNQSASCSIKLVPYNNKRAANQAVQTRGSTE